jgi:hypothetical protein
MISIRSRSRSRSTGQLNAQNAKKGTLVDESLASVDGLSLAPDEATHVGRRDDQVLELGVHARPFKCRLGHKPADVPAGLGEEGKARPIRGPAPLVHVIPNVHVTFSSDYYNRLSKNLADLEEADVGLYIELVGPLLGNRLGLDWVERVGEGKVPTSVKLDSWASTTMSYAKSFWLR